MVVEEDFQQSKDHVGLDHAQVRQYIAWKRHVILVMSALAALAVIPAVERRRNPDPVLPTTGQDAPPSDGCGLIARPSPRFAACSPTSTSR